MKGIFIVAGRMFAHSSKCNLLKLSLKVLVKLNVNYHKFIRRDEKQN
jgi:hypothetical protein